MVLRSPWQLAGLLVWFAIFAAVVSMLIKGLPALGVAVSPDLAFGVAAIAGIIPCYYLAFTIPERRKRARQARAQADALAAAKTPLRDAAKLPDGGRTDFDPHWAFQTRFSAYAIDPDRRLMRTIISTDQGVGDVLLPLKLLIAVADGDPKAPRHEVKKTGLRRWPGPTLVLTFEENGQRHEYEVRFPEGDPTLLMNWRNILLRCVAENRSDGRAADTMDHNA